MIRSKYKDINYNGLNMNILNKLDLVDLDPEFVEFYDVTTRMPMTTLSYKIYGDIKSWWILYLMNKDQIQYIVLNQENSCLRNWQKELVNA